MAFEGLVAELKRLIKDRVPGSQAKESIESYGREKYLLELRFVSSSRTFGSKIGKEYEGGQTIVGVLTEHDLEVAVMMLPSSNDWVKDRAKQEEFELWARLVSYDTLYDRAIFEHALAGDSQEQQHTESEPIFEQPQAVLPEKTSQPHEVIKQELRRTKGAKLPKKAKSRKASERKLYRKSKDAAAPSRDKRMFWGKPRNLKVVKRPSSPSKKCGHAVPSKKPLKRTLKSSPKVNYRKGGQNRRPFEVPKFRVSNQPSSVVPPNPAEIVRVLRKRNTGGYATLNSDERKTLQNSGVSGMGAEGFESSKGCRRVIAVSLVLIAIPCCTSSSLSTFFGCFCLIVAMSFIFPDYIREFHSRED